MLSVKIREADPSDVEDVMMLNRLTLPENYPAQFFYEIYSQFPKTFLVAKANGVVAGYIMLRMEKAYSILKVSTRAHVISVAVHPSYRRQGIGMALLVHASERAYKEYGAQEVYLEVRVTNAPAISLYKKLGFEIKGVNKRYYSDGEDAYVMEAAFPLLYTGQGQPF